MKKEYFFTTENDQINELLKVTVKHVERLVGVENFTFPIQCIWLNRQKIS